MRQIELEIEIAASPEEVWRAVSTAEGISSWFALVAKVEPGVGGTISIAWTPEMEGSSRIDAWEPGRRRGAGRQGAPRGAAPRAGRRAGGGGGRRDPPGC